MERVLVFGRGKLCKNKISAIKDKYEVIGYLDNSVSKEEYDTELEASVYPPSEIHRFDNCKIILMSLYFCDMYAQLLDMGIDNSRIEVGLHYPPLCMIFDNEMFEHGEYIQVGNEGLTYNTLEGDEIPFSNMEELRGAVRQAYSSRNLDVKRILSLDVKPVSCRFGIGRGKAVDRYYIEKFLEENQTAIKNTVMEIADDTYIKMFGGEKVDEKIILHVKGWGRNAIKGNFETGEGLSENMVDCLICTQTLQYIYDLKSAVENIYKIVKPGGCVLLTVPGIKSLCTYDDENWGEKWSFTEKSVKQLFEPVFGEKNCDIKTYGNVKVATAYLYGICCEDMDEKDFEYNDKQVPFIITGVMRKI